MRHDGLQCEIERLEYDYKLKEAKFFFPENNCCDMTGAIKLAKRVDPEVVYIATYMGGEPDTVYVRYAWLTVGKVTDGWEAM